MRRSVKRSWKNNEKEWKQIREWLLLTSYHFLERLVHSQPIHFHCFISGTYCTCIYIINDQMLDGDGDDTEETGAEKDEVKKDTSHAPDLLEGPSINQTSKYNNQADMYVQTYVYTCIGAYIVCVCVCVCVCVYVCMYVCMYVYHVQVHDIRIVHYV